MDGDARDAASGIAWVRVELSADRSTIGIGAADSAIGHIEARPDDAPIVGGIPEGPHWGLVRTFSTGLSTLLMQRCTRRFARIPTTRPHG